MVMMGTTLLNRYRLDEELGTGGMGAVYQAHDTLLDRDVAIKVVTDPRLGTAGRARLLTEARAVARLNHPNIVAIYDVAETTGERATPFIVMELVQGNSLDQQPPRSLAETLEIARQICAALEHAHEHGIIHRDLKPENVAISPDGTVKLMDFGLARQAAGEHDEQLFVGTAAYLAPEQARGEAVDARADLYALGVLLYEALTGRLPFSGDDPMAVIAQHLNATPAPPRALKPDLPEELEAIVVRLLAKHPADRFASAREVMAALAAIPGFTNGRPGAARRNNLPAEVTRFIGREKEITEVQHLLAGTRLLTLTGSGGTGKSRLALRAVQEIQNGYPDGVWLVDVGPLGEAGLVAQSVAGVLGVRDEPGAPLTRRITDALHSKNLLLILDNCEHLIEAVAALAEEILRACPEVRLLVTSREALGIAGETDYRVPSLSLPPVGMQGPFTAEAAGQYEAVRLFVDRAATVRPDFALSDANAGAVVQICQQLDGVPLALELAAARVRALGVEQIASRLDDRFRLLSGGSRTALPRQQTLRALIDWSWDLLAEDEKRLFRHLGVFVGGWTLEAAEYVCSGAAKPGENIDVLDLLTRLVDKSLVVVEENNGTARYRLLETIRQYAREKLAEAEESEAKAVQQCHQEFFLTLAETAEPVLRSGGQLGWLDQLEVEHDNLRAALRGALSSEPAVRSQDAGLRLAGALARFWYLHGYWSEGRGWLRKALEQPLAVDAPDALKRARARALAGLAWLMDESGEEKPLYQESLALYRELGDHWGIAFALRGLGASLLIDAEPELSLVRLNQSIALFREQGDAWGLAVALFNKGWQIFFQEDAAGAVALWEESLAKFRQTGDRWGIAVALGALSYAARRSGDYTRAVELSEESLSHFRAIGDKAGIATSLSRLGTVAFRRGDYRQAISLIEESLPLQRELSEQGSLASGYTMLGQIATYQGDFGRANAYLRQSEAIAGEIEDGFVTAYSQNGLALASYFAGDLERAEELWKAVLEALRAGKDRLNSGLALNGLGLVAWRRGDLGAAQAQLEESLSQFKEDGDRHYIATAYNDLGRVALARGDAAGTMGLSRKALGIFRDLGDRQGIAEALESLALALGETRRAALALGAAQAVREELGAPLPPVERPAYEQALERLKQTLGEGEFKGAWRAGREMPLDQAISAATAAAAAKPVE